MTPTTDPTGRSFLSYRRTRLHEARLLIGAQHDLGIPTWHDLGNLGPSETETALRRALEDPRTANAIVWLTPEVRDSPIIRDIEAPALVRRARSGDGFFLLPVAAGGLEYKEAASVAGPLLGAANLAAWNMRKMPNDPITSGDAAAVAERVLDERLAVIHRPLAPDEPLRIRLHTRGAIPQDTGGHALILDWTRHFSSPDHRQAARQVWQEVLIPALGRVADTIDGRAHGRRVLASGQLAIAAAVAIGVTFLAPRQISIAWQQHPAGEPWSLEVAPEPAGFTSELIPNNPSGTDLAVLLCVNSDVQPAFGLTIDASGTRARFRATLVIERAGDRFSSTQPLTAGQAVDIAHRVQRAVREALSQYPRIREVHLFMAVPVGLAMLIGQLLNTVGTVQTYEHVPTNPVPYQPAALLHPSG